MEPVVIYPGRFQPPHSGHHMVYKWACEKFGENNVWIATSNKTGQNSPYDFETKRKLWKELFHVNRIVCCKNPAFDPVEITREHPDRPVIFVVSEKDRKRYEKYLKEYDEKEILPNTNECRRFIVSPLFGDVCATFIRNALKEKNHNVLYRLYGMKYQIFKELMLKEVQTLLHE